MRCQSRDNLSNLDIKLVIGYGLRITSPRRRFTISILKYKDIGLIPAIIQDADTGAVLMLGYMNEEAVRRTLSSGDVWFFSRSRKEMWHKGESSGNRLIVRELWQDCDNDTILVKAKPLGPVCHTGNQTCFFQRLTESSLAGERRKQG